MIHLWNKILSWLNKYDESLVDCFNAPIAEETIITHERHLGTTLPDDIRFFYINCCNGEGDDDEIFAFGGWKLLSVEDVVVYWRRLKEIIPESEMIPFLIDGCGGYYCFDYAPRLYGKKSEVIRLDSELSERSVIYDSFTDYLTDLVKQMEGGDFIYNEEDRIVERRDGHSDRWAKEKYMHNK